MANSSPATKPDTLQLGQFIPLHYHHSMLSDRARTGAFREAIDKVVRPGSTVVDLGSGTGILSFFAARHAARVYSVELNPELHAFARRNLANNPGAERIELVRADAAAYIPPKPVDFVICEMLHSAMLREKQLPVIAEFKKNYLRRFGLPLPRFIPEAAFLGVQPVQHPFEFFGYRCPIPAFQDPPAPPPETLTLADPIIYGAIDYAQDFPLNCQWQGAIPITTGGMLTALRFITKNILAVLPDVGRAVEWHNAYLLMPVPEPLEVRPGTRLDVRFAYPAGAPIEALAESLHIAVLPTETLPVTVRVRSVGELAAKTAVSREP